MHIPDGYLGPPTYLASYAACIPLWGLAARKVKHGAGGAARPLTRHLGGIHVRRDDVQHPACPVRPPATRSGGVLIAIAVGPWGAALSISIALVIQALLFGDGGITAIGANCLNIAFVMPFTGYAVYRWLSRTPAVPEGASRGRGDRRRGWDSPWPPSPPP